MHCPWPCSCRTVILSPLSNTIKLHQRRTAADPAEPGVSDGYHPVSPVADDSSPTPRIHTPRRLQLRRRLSWSARRAPSVCKSVAKAPKFRILDPPPGARTASDRQERGPRPFSLVSWRPTGSGAWLTRCGKWAANFVAGRPTKMIIYGALRSHTWSAGPDPWRQDPYLRGVKPLSQVTPPAGRRTTQPRTPPAEVPLPWVGSGG
jgi:hypothetical protein